MNDPLRPGIPRRRVLLLAPAVLGAPVGLTGCSGALKGPATLDEARRAVAALNPRWRTRRGWTVPEVLNHLAQSIEYSMSGFPVMKGRWFRYSVGPAAFAYFNARGAMSHDLTEPIPGAPAISGTLEVAKARLLAALRAFEAHQGTLGPHFAYGSLDREQYLRAHLMHVANHWTEFVQP